MRECLHPVVNRPPVKHRTSCGNGSAVATAGECLRLQPPPETWSCQRGPGAAAWTNRPASRSDHIASKRRSVTEEVAGMAEKKSALAEFEDFIMQGNVIDLAVAVIIAQVFTPIIKDLVN